MTDPTDDRRDADACASRTAESESIRLPIIDEALHVAKVAVDQGGYRFTKRIEVDERLVETTLVREDVTIERVPIGRLLDGDVAPGPRHEGDTMVLSVVEEVVVTQVRLRLVEEVRVTRMRRTYMDAQPVTLRREQIEVERLGAETPVIRSSHPPSDRPNDPQGQPE